MDKLQISKNNTTTQWYTIDDCCSKNFFEFHKDTNKKTIILQLIDSHQLLKSDYKIGESIHKYYKDLYTNDQIVKNNEDARQQCLRNAPLIITLAMKTKLSHAIILEEIYKSIWDMPCDKMPGCDTISKELI